MKICVIGLGKIGLPLAVHFAKMGNSVIGADINEKTVNQINSGQEPFPEEENLQEFLSEVVANKSKANGNMRKLMDSSLAIKFGWNPKVNIDEGIKKTIDWYLLNKMEI